MTVRQYFSVVGFFFLCACAYIFARTLDGRIYPQQSPKQVMQQALPGHPPIESCIICIIPINDTIENWCFDKRRITITSGTGVDIYQTCPIDSNRYHINMQRKQ